MSFYKILSKYYDELFPVTDKKVRQVKQLVNIYDKTVLDIGCATGKIAIKLSKKAKSIVGIDLDEEMIKIANQCELPNIEFLKMNMLHLNQLPQTFDTILCLGNTLSHLNSLKTVNDFIAKCFDKLNPNGQLLIQIVNYENITKEKQLTFPTKETEHLIFNRTYLLKETGKIDFKMKLKIKGSENEVESTNTLLMIQKADIEETLKHTGHSNYSFYGDYYKSPYQNDSPALIISAKK